MIVLEAYRVGSDGYRGQVGITIGSQSECIYETRELYPDANEAMMVAREHFVKALQALMNRKD